MLERVLFLSTKWEEEEKYGHLERAEGREEELKTKYWQELLAAGCKIGRHYNTHESAWDAVDQILPPPATPGQTPVLPAAATTDEV